MRRVFNFNPGPAVLAPEVFKKVSESVLDHEGSGLSVLEIGHRSRTFTSIMESADRDLRELLDIPQEYAVLFLGGGASMQFCMAPMNLLPEGATADYTDTGLWAWKAIQEAGLFGNVNIACSSRDKNYAFIPKDLKLTPGAKYLHLTSNNTIYGTQWREFPRTECMLVADMSSDILSRPIDIRRFGLIYAGAQKNAGPAGVTLVIVRKDVVGKSGRKLPSILDYARHIQEKALFNTPPIYAVFVVSEVLKWLKKRGGVAAIRKVNERKAARLYKAIDESGMFRGTAAKEDRSLMNVCFVIGDAEKEKRFQEGAVARGLMNLPGHRTVGGFRASLYNAMPEEGVDALIAWMKEFEASSL